MRLVALFASAILLVASTASAHVFDPQASFLSIRVGALKGAPINGEASALGNAILTGGPGAEVLQQFGKGMGMGNLFETKGRDSGAAFFTGTPLISNLFFTIQNGNATFTHGTGRGTFQGSPLCTTACFGANSGLIGTVLIEISGPTVPLNLGVIGAGGVTSVALGATAIILEGAEWVTETVVITNVATNLITITNNANGRLGVTGVGFTLQPTVNENTDVLSAFGVTNVTIAGTTSFITASATAGTQQVTLVAPAWVDASGATGNPPIPAAGIQVLRYVPEPGTLLLLGSAVAGLLVVGRKRMKR